MSIRLDFRIEVETRRCRRLLHVAGSALALVLAVFLSSCASGGGRTVPLDYIRESLESTILNSWRGCSPGDFVESTARQGNDVIQCKQTYEGLNQDGTVRVKTERSGTTVMEASPFGGGEEVTDFLEGTETVDVAGVQVVCNVLQGEGTKGAFKLWISPEIPGAVVRMESPHGSLEATNFKKSTQ